MSNELTLFLVRMGLLAAKKLVAGDDDSTGLEDSFIAADSDEEVIEIAVVEGKKILKEAGLDDPTIEMVHELVMAKDRETVKEVILKPENSPSIFNALGKLIGGLIKAIFG